jgi:hypothetical protein
LKPHHEGEEQGLALHTAEQERARREVEEERSGVRKVRMGRSRHGLP